MKISGYPLKRLGPQYGRSVQGEIRLEAFGWWLRLFLGTTFRPDKPRFGFHRFYGHRLLRWRLFGEQVCGVQWRRAER